MNNSPSNISTIPKFFIPFLFFVLFLTTTHARNHLIPELAPSPNPNLNSIEAEKKPISNSNSISSHKNPTRPNSKSTSSHAKPTPISNSDSTSSHVKFDKNSPKVCSDSFSRREDKEPATKEPTARSIAEGPNFEGAVPPSHSIDTQLRRPITNINPILPNLNSTSSHDKPTPISNSDSASSPSKPTRPNSNSTTSHTKPRTSPNSNSTSSHANQTLPKSNSPPPHAKPTPISDSTSSPPTTTPLNSNSNSKTSPHVKPTLPPKSQPTSPPKSKPTSLPKSKSTPKSVVPSKKNVTSSPYEFSNHFCLSRRLDVKKTFCLHVLRSSPTSTNADDNLALLTIVANSAVEFGNKNIALLKKLSAKKTTKPDLKTAITDCVSAYEGYLKEFKTLVEESKIEAQLAGYDSELATLEINRCVKALGETKNDEIEVQNEDALDYARLAQNIADAIE